MPFLTNNYEKTEAGSQYLKFAPNDSRVIRIISDALEGFQVFKDGKPIRWATGEPIPEEARTSDDKVRNFAAFGVYDYDDKKYKLFCCATRSILQEIVNFSEMEGKPFGYTLKITRKGAGMETKYYVKLDSHNEAEEEVVQAQQNFLAEVDMNKLLTGGNPFEGGNNE
jgi:hypothetical protein